MNSASNAPRQIPLRFGQYQQFDFDSFIAADNEPLVVLLRKMAGNQVQHHVYLWGPAGSGKSHLLQAACKLASQAGLHVAYVPLEYVDELSPDMLHGLGELDLVCVDSLDTVAGHIAWQQALVWLYNELRDNGRSLIIAGSSAPQSLALEVEDLRSRLGWDQVFQTRQPADDIKLRILQLHARQRSFELPDEVCDYLIHRVQRDLNSLIALLDRIDEASLAEQRKITVPFIKKIIA